jgi:hypothetical protein
MTRRPALPVVNSRSRRGVGAAETVGRVLQEAGVPIFARNCERASDLPDLIRAARSEKRRDWRGGTAR